MSHVNYNPFPQTQPSSPGLTRRSTVRLHSASFAEARCLGPVDARVKPGHDEWKKRSMYPDIQNV